MKHSNGLIYFLTTTLILSVFLSLSCRSEIPSFSQKNATEKSLKAWQDYYDALPELKPLPNNKKYVIRVKRIKDKRLDDLSEKKYEELYAQIEADVSRYLGYQVSLVDVGSEDILQFFSKQKIWDQPQFKAMIGAHILRPSNENDKLRLKETIKKAIQDKPWEVLKRYVTDDSIKSKDVNRLTDYFLDQFLTKYDTIGKIPVFKGKGVLREGEYKLTQQYGYWSAVMYEARDADLYITNSIIDSADDQMPVYVINRGGINSGITENNRYNEYQGVVVLTLLPFISGDNYFHRERGTIYESLVLPVISMMAVHEFGHLLRRYDEYYDLPSSPQNAPVGIRYQDWYQKIIDNGVQIRRLRVLKKY